ncbi:MAG: hypothetical protein ABL982_25665 [Vicinamibacterales bacterium]
MPTIMCARRLWTLLGDRGALPPRNVVAEGTNKLQAWSAQDVETAAGHLVVALEEVTYLTLVFPFEPFPVFLHNFSAALSMALRDLGVPTAIAEAEAEAVVLQSRFAKNDNRSLQGSVTDVTSHAGWRLEGARRWDFEAIRKAQRHLNHMPHCRHEPSLPSDGVRLLFSKETPPH